MNIFDITITNNINILCNINLNNNIDVIVYNSTHELLYKTEFSFKKNISYWISISQLTDITIDFLDNGNVIYTYSNISKKTDEEIFIITAYCNTQEKLNLLRECISNIKKINNNHICIYSHSVIPEDIQKSVNYVIYDYSNPLLNFKNDNKALIQWNSVHKINRKLISTLDDFGYAVMSQWKKSINYLENLGYEKFYMTNYDVFFTDNFFIKNKDNLTDYDASFFYFGDFRNFELNLMFFSIKKPFSTIFFNSMSKKDYLNTSDQLETYVYKKIEHFENNYNIIKTNFCDYGGFQNDENATELSSKHGYKLFDNHKLLTIFGGINLSTNLFEIVLLNITDDVNKFEFYTEKEQIVITNFTDDILLHTTKLDKDEIYSTINNNKIIIKINNIEINKDIYKVFLNSTIEKI